MSIVCVDNSCTHLGKRGDNSLHECFIQHLEYRVDAAHHISLGEFIRLFKGSLFEFNYKFLVHAEDGDFTILMR